LKQLFPDEDDDDEIRFKDLSKSNESEREVSISQRKISEQESSKIQETKTTFQVVVRILQF
jgi:hypothetical protein